MKSVKKTWKWDISGIFSNTVSQKQNTFNSKRRRRAELKSKDQRLSSRVFSFWRSCGWKWMMKGDQDWRRRRRRRGFMHTVERSKILSFFLGLTWYIYTFLTLLEHFIVNQNHPKCLIWFFFSNFGIFHHILSN